MTTFDDYKEQLAGLPENKFIGAIVWFSFYETDVTREMVEKLFLDYGLDERFIPNPIKPVDAFRRATSRNIREYDYPGAGRTATIYIDEVDYDEDRVVQHIFRKVRDRKAVQLHHTKVGEAIFYRQSRAARRKGAGGESVKFTMKESELSDEEKDIVRDYIDTVHKSYERNKGYLTVDSLRGMARRYVVSLNAIAVRPSGGVYFVHKSRVPTVHALSQVIDQLGDSCTLHLLPLIDTGQQREMLTEAFQDEVVDECDKLLRSIGEINSNHRGGIPPKKYADVRTQLDEVMQRADEYTRVLGLAQDRSAASIEVAMQALLEMAQRIEH